MLLALVCVMLPARTEGPPAPPTALKVVLSDAVVTASWSAQDVDRFQVEYADNVGFRGAIRRTVRATSVRLAELEPGRTYFLRVRSLRPSGGPGSATSPIRVDTTYPHDPPELVVGSDASTEITVAWDAVPKAARYELQVARGLELTDPDVIETIKTRKTVRGLEPGTIYTTRLRVLDEHGEPLSRWSEPAVVTTAAYLPLGVGTYNVMKSEAGGWPSRRHAVAALIRKSAVDVVGLQEATPRRVAGGVPQFQDVANLLGKDWALTRSTRGATGETRTVYNTKRLELIDEGYRPIAGSSRFRGVTRYVSWAVFRQRSTGKPFLFVNTHFVPGKNRKASAHRASAASQLVATIRAVNTRDLPVVVVGDFNSMAYRTSGNAVYRTLVGSGLVDPLVRSGRLGQAEDVVDADLKTVNGMRRTAPRRANPPFIDHIFVSPMKVAQWQVVADLDRGGRFVGTIPSDHNLVRATVFLP